MRLGELCAAAAVGPETVRYYERRGLLVEGIHFTRPTGGFREYTDAAVDRLALVARAKRAGLTLAELSRWADAWERGTLPAEQRRAFFDDKLAQVDERLAELRAVRTYLAEKIDELDAG